MSTKTYTSKGCGKVYACGAAEVVDRWRPILILAATSYQDPYCLGTDWLLGGT